MAADVAEAMETLNPDAAYVMGISQGGMIASMVSCRFFQEGFNILVVTTAEPQSTWLENELSIINQSIWKLISCWIRNVAPHTQRA